MQAHEQGHEIGSVQAERAEMRELRYLREKKR